MAMITLCNSEDCTQCFSCVYSCPKSCIKLIATKNGSRIPSIDREKCVECGLCIKSCHILTPRREKSTPIHTYAGWNRVLKVRKDSSSGGVFSAIASHILNQGGIVYGATMDDALFVHHIRVEAFDDLIKLRGSKYVQSNLNGIYKQIKKDLLDQREVLFVGSPCQVSGLYSFLGKQYDKLLTVDFICHGVPIQDSFDKYLSKIGINSSNTREVLFRYKKGWGMQMARIKSNGKYRLISPSNAFYLRAFLKGMMFSDACYRCRYSEVNRVGDITIADFWEIGTKIPFMRDTRDGVSLVLVNTHYGESIIDKCQDIELIERSLQEAIDGNHNLHSVSIRPKGSELFLEDMDKMSISDLCAKYNLKPSWKDYLRPVKRYFEELLTGHSR